MAKSKHMAVILSIFLVSAFSACGAVQSSQKLWPAASQHQLATSNAGVAVTKEPLPELKEKLWKATSVKERNEIIDSFKCLPGPDAKAAHRNRA